MRGRPDFPTDGRDAVVDYLWQHATAGDLRADLAKTLRSQVTVIPLLASFNGTLDAEGLQADPAVALLPARVRDGLLARAHPGGWPRAAAARQAAEARSNMVRALEAAGVRLATGVDAESNGYNIPGAGVHRELALLVAAGLTPAQALRAATINCAEMLGTSTTLGQIKSGYKADLFVVDGDPLAKIEDLRRIRLVVRGGEALDPAALIAQARRAAR